MDAVILVIVTNLEVGNVGRGVTPSVSQCVSNRVEPGIELALELCLERIQVDRLERSANIRSASTTHKVDNVLSNNLSRVLDYLDLGQSEGLSVTTVPDIRDQRGNRRGTLDHLDLCTTDGLGSVDLDTDQVNSVQSCVRTSERYCLVA